MSVNNINHNNPALMGLSKVEVATAHKAAPTTSSAFAAYLEQARAVDGVGKVSPQAVSAHNSTNDASAISSFSAATTTISSNVVPCAATNNAVTSTTDASAKNSVLFGNGHSHNEQFAQLLAQAQQNLGLNTTLTANNSSRPTNNDSSATAALLASVNGLNTAKEAKEAKDAVAAATTAATAATDATTVSANSGVKSLNHTSLEALNSLGLFAAEQSQLDLTKAVFLQDKTLDFSTMLPTGTRDFLRDLKCSESELNAFVNLMVFGHENGPHGQNASQYFGTTEMKTGDLMSKMQDLVDKSHLNSTALNSSDFDFVLRPNGNALGQTLALEQGASLEERSIERELDNSFQRDMALMEILARANNQNANIF